MLAEYMPLYAKNAIVMWRFAVTSKLFGERVAFNLYSLLLPATITQQQEQYEQCPNWEKLCAHFMHVAQQR